MCIVLTAAICYDLFTHGLRFPKPRLLLLSPPLLLSVFNGCAGSSKELTAQPIQSTTYKAKQS
jgi:hypothetical protein